MAGTTNTVTFSDTPGLREIFDVRAYTVESTICGVTVIGLGPTAAPVAISGRAVKTNGRGINRATVILTNQGS